eukprot:9164192-Pyramimonas_sp.AAC.1
MNANCWAKMDCEREPSFVPDDHPSEECSGGTMVPPWMMRIEVSPVRNPLVLMYRNNITETPLDPSVGSCPL